MRKRSEVSTKKPKEDKPSAAERTEPIAFLDPNERVVCTICEEPAAVKDCTVRPNGKLECPACGAIIAGAVKKPDTNTGRPVKPKEEDIPFPESEQLTKPSEKAPTAADVAKVINAPAFGSKREAEKQEHMLKDFVSGSDPIVKGDAFVHETPPKAYCSRCGAEWSIVNNQVWPNCGCKGTLAVDTPNKASHYSPPGGSARASILGRTLRVTRGKANYGYPGASFGGFSIGPFEVSVELGPGASILEVSRALRADLKKMADDAFDEEMKWYVDHLAKLRASLAEGE